MAQTTNDYEAIRNTLARYCIALDKKDWKLLETVFVKDVDARYPFGGGISGVDALADAISKRLAPVTTQHALTTQTIELAKDGRTATASTYFTGVHLGQGKWEGQLVTAYGVYHDELAKKAEGGLWGHGRWLVTKREVVFIGRVGEEGVMKGEDA